MISTLTIGSSTIGRALSIASRNALRAGGDERDFLRVDRMVLAVVDDDAHVLQRKAAIAPVPSTCSTPFCTAGMNWCGIAPPFVESTNSKPVPRAQRLDAQRHLAELAGAAGLLLVPVEALGRRGDRLAIGNARRPRLDLELELARHALEHRAQVQLAQAAQHRLVAVRIVLDDERRILGDHPVQHVGDPLLVAALLRA